MSLATTLLRAPCGIPAQRNEMLSLCIWFWTESHGKYNGCRYWTKAALAAASVRELAHEHVVPRKLIVERLRSLIEPDEDAVRELFEAMAVGCVVTRVEHSELPEAEWEELVEDPWARYRLAGIDVVDTWKEAA